MFSFCMNMTAWQWMCAGIGFLSFELMFPGIFMLWFGISGLVTAALVYIFGFSGALAIALFLGIGIAISFYSYKYQKKQAKFLVNNVKNMMIGKILTLQDPLKNGHGRAKIGDSHWTLTGPDLPAGSKVKVVEVSGNSLVIEELK